MDVTGVRTPRTRALAYELRRVTDSAVGPDGKKLTLRQLGELIGKSHTSISLWRKGERIPNTEDVASLLTACGVNGPQRDEIITLARRASDTEWLASGIPGGSEQLAGVLDAESEATKIVECNLLMVPGLLQTGDYARAIIGGGQSIEQVDTLVRLRVGRRDVLIRREPIELFAMVGEAALRDIVGDKGVMLDQLRHIDEMRRRGNVTVLVIPNGKGWHPGLMGPFTVYNFAADPSIVYIEHHRTGAFLSDEKNVAAYEGAILEVQAVALDSEASAALIADIITELGEH